MAGVADQDVAAIEVAIRKVQTEINNVEKKIAKFEDLPEDHPDKARLPALEQKEAALRQEKAALQQEKAALQQEKAALQQEKAALRQKEVYLLTQEDEELNVRKLLYIKPSDLTPSQFRKTQHASPQGPLFICGRESGAVGAPLQLPACLAHPAYGKLQDALESPTGLPSRQAQELALALATTLPSFQVEDTKKKALQGQMEHFFWPLAVQPEKRLFQGSIYPADKAIMRSNAPTPLAIFEFKREEDGKSYFQSQMYYGQSLNSVPPAAAASSILPAVMVELCGPCIRIGALFAAGTGSGVRASVCDLLSPHVHFMLQPHDKAYMTKLACMLDSLKACIMELDSSCLVHPAGVPYPLPYPLCGAPFTDVQHVGGKRFMYTAVMQSQAGEERAEGGVTAPPERADVAPSSSAAKEHQGTDVWVKFAQATTYSRLIHSTLAGAGLAPSLHALEKLPGGMVQVVMELLDPALGWHCLEALSPKELSLAMPDVRLAVSRLHNIQIVDPDSGMSGFVAHGDMRLANIMVREKPNHSWEVKFVDLDWACVEGFGRYPPFLNFELPWPTGVDAGECILRQHDDLFLDATYKLQLKGPRGPRPVAAVPRWLRHQIGGAGLRSATSLLNRVVSPALCSPAAFRLSHGFKIKMF